MGERAEALLTRCIPDLHGNLLPATWRRIRLANVVKTERGHMRRLELFLVVHFQKRSFANGTISQDDYAQLVCHLKN